MEHQIAQNGHRKRRKRFDMSAWAKRWLLPYWGLGVVAVLILGAFLAVILWFAL